MAGAMGIFSSYYLTHNLFFVEGEVSAFTIEADKSVTYEDAARTEANRHAAADRVSDIYVFDTSILEGQVAQLDQLFTVWEELALEPEPEPIPQSAPLAAPTAEQGELLRFSRDSSGRDDERRDRGGELLSSVSPDGGDFFDEGVQEGEELQDGQEAREVAPQPQTPPEPTKLEKARPYITQLQIRESTAREILNLDYLSMQALRSEAVNIMTQQWTKGVRGDEVEESIKKILDEVYLRINNEDQASFLQSIFRFIDLKANFIFDEETTGRAREDAASKEPPVLNTVYRNQRVIGKGEIVTSYHIEVLKALGYQRSEAPYLMLIGAALLICCVFYLLSRYARLYRPKDLPREKCNPLLSLMFLLILGLARLIVAIVISPEPAMAEQVAYLIPTSTGAILIAILMNEGMGFFFGAVVSIFVGLLSGGGLSYAVVAVTGSIIGVYGISRFTNRSEWTKAGLMIAMVNVSVILSFGVMNNLDRTIVFYGVVIGAVNGFFSPILAYGSLPFLESAFRITTSVSLMELSDSRQPLLKELLLKAPGTYHHSILVGNLAEAAADEIGADAVLVRVGAYYHDIGKMKRPYFFVENQMADANPHEKLTPALSALILSSHVKDGLETGRKNNLPEKVLDCIGQHHGDGVMAYFYRKAQREAEDPDQIKEIDFRYPGPRPQSKETALVMLADSVEAAIRSMHVTGDKLEIVKKLINDKMQDGQLDDSNLSLNDLKTIAEVFTAVLNGIYHNRIEYPDNVLEVMNKERALSADADEGAGEAAGEGGDAGAGAGAGTDAGGDAGNNADIDLEIVDLIREELEPESKS
ncbi:MAG: HDIG domain-containing protein [Clostridiales bacterium]|nr:HDIG domain-containing protein [Clostridiales bacterium]